MFERTEYSFGTIYVYIKMCVYAYTDINFVVDCRSRRCSNE